MPRAGSTVDAPPRSIDRQTAIDRSRDVCSYGRQLREQRDRPHVRRRPTRHPARDLTGCKRQRDGERFRLSRDEDTAYEPDPEGVRAMLAVTAGSWADLDSDTMIPEMYEAREAGSRSLDPPAGHRLGRPGGVRCAR